jgi:hypothetical protein
MTPYRPGPIVLPPEPRCGLRQAFLPMLPATIAIVALLVIDDRWPWPPGARALILLAVVSMLGAMRLMRDYGFAAGRREEHKAWRAAFEPAPEHPMLRPATRDPHAELLALLKARVGPLIRARGERLWR